MKVLVVGAGSIGRRHLANLRNDAARSPALLVFDADVSRAQVAADEYGARAFSSLANALADRPDVSLVCSPTHLHLEHALACARAGSHLFVEKPLAASQHGVEVLAAEVKERGLHAMVGCNLRFDETYRHLKTLLDDGALGRVHSAHLHFGFDLRRWRKGIDYRSVYSAHRDQGGGIVLDAIHEIDLALWLFGPPARVLSSPRRTGLLEGDVEDAADLVIEFRSGVVCSLHLDYLDPVYRRTASVGGDLALVEADFADKRLTVRGADGAVQQFTGSEPAGDHNGMYVRELSHFLDVVEKKAKPIASLDDGIRALQVALDARDRAPIVSYPVSPLGLTKLPVVIQARIGSSRLPGKVLKEAAGKTMLELLVERLKRAERVEKIIIATSDAPADRAIVAEAERLGLPWFAGSESDVLGRYLGAVHQFDLPAVVRITGDCPLLDPAVADAAIAAFLEDAPDYLSNVSPRSVPDGMDVEVVTREALERADRECDDPKIREHVTLHIVRHPERYLHRAMADRADPRLAPLRITLDTANDYALIRAVFETLYPDDPAFGLEAVVALLAEPRMDALYRAAAGGPFPAG